MTVQSRIAALGALALAASPASAQEAGAVSAGQWEAVVACAAQGGANERHRCIDDVLRTAGVLDPQREQAAARESFGQPAREPEPAPVPAAAVPQAPPPVTGVETTVADALIGGDRLLIVATAEGAVWKQLDGAQFRRAPAAGTAFAVEEGALGSYRCKIGSDVFRCRRMD
jgi:hypothetical protein